MHAQSGILVSKCYLSKASIQLSRNKDDHAISPFYPSFAFLRIQQIPVKLACAKCGKGFKIGTNEAYNIKIKIRLGGISKTFCFCSHANMAASDKGISLKKKFFKKKFT